MENNEEASEEEQMEKFFALIKSTKDMRDRLSKEKKEEKAKGTIWNPTFQPEDFIDDEELARLHSTSQVPGVAPSEKEVAEKELLPEEANTAPTAAPADENGNKKKESDDDLDLTLSL